MERLVDYRSDEDPSSEDEVKHSEKCAPIETSTNFFNIKESQSESRSSTHTKSTYEPLLSHLKEGGKKNGKVEVPDSDFWSGFDPSVNLQSDGDCSHQVPIQSTQHFKSGHQSQNYIDSKQMAHISRKRPNNNTEPYSHYYNTYSDSKIKNCKFDTGQNRLTDDVKKKSCQVYDNSNINLGCDHSLPVEARKIFFIHHKVTPGLSQNLPCKYPSQLDSSWLCHDNAINRISWNIPNYSHLILTAGWLKKNLV